jgi:hypothetical protein
MWLGDIAHGQSSEIGHKPGNCIVTYRTNKMVIFLGGRKYL